MEKQTKNVNMFNLFSESFLVYLNNLLPAVTAPAVTSTGTALKFSKLSQYRLDQLMVYFALLHILQVDFVEFRWTPSELHLK